jgi:4-diphosphocytidyl-2-C-methyl-D-erythritol kinase
MIITAPAKINLYLKVLSKRDDGYHQIETFFERISIFDRLSIESVRDSSTTIVCDDSRVPLGEESLMGRIARAFREKSGKKVHFYVKLEKNIPLGAGLGGGSSDAAALLKGMNSLTGFPLDEAALYEVSSQLGADIPFFVSEGSFARGTERGDIIQKVETDLEIWHILVTPPFEVSTRDIYNKISAFGLTNNRGVDRMFTAFLKQGNISGIAENLCNDLQAVTLRDFPTLEHVFSVLKTEGAKGVLLSGSGPTVFGIFGHEEVIKAEEKVRHVFPAEEGWKVFTARTY